MNRTHALVPAALALLLAIPARAAVFIPNSFADTADGICDSHCTLRDAVLAANARPGFDAILLKPGTYRLTLEGTGEDLGATGDLDIRDDLAVVGDGGTGAPSTFIEGNALASPGWNDRVIDVMAGVRLELQGVTVRLGRTSGQPGAGIRVAGELHLSRSSVTGNVAADSTGGGLHVQGGAVADVVESTIHHNEAGSGGGLYVAGTLNLTNSTVSGNRALTGPGGGLYFTDSAEGTLSNATVAFNGTPQKGGGIFAEGDLNTPPFDGPAVRNTILEGNSGGRPPSPVPDPYYVTGRDCWGPVVSGGHNLLGDGSSCFDFEPAKSDLVGTTFQSISANLTQLGEFGGPTPTHALLGSSPARDMGADCEPRDQRGAGREGACDIGAFEETRQCVSGGANLCLNGGRFQVTTRWRTSQSSGPGQGVQLTDDSGFVWFFSPANIELTIKVLNGCGLNGRYWVFVGGLTNVGVEVFVTDTLSGAGRGYSNPLNTTFAPVLDTNAFATCP